MKKLLLPVAFLFFGFCFVANGQQVKTGSKATSPQKGKPNIVIIWGDDIGQSNLSCYSMGVM